MQPYDPKEPSDRSERPTDPCGAPTLTDEDRAFFDLRDLERTEQEYRHLDELFT
jgi:hypothetical protein